MNANEPKNRMMKAGNMLVRVITLPPLMAVAALLILRLRLGLFPGSSLMMGIFFLCVLPLMAYPVCFAIPALRKKGRTVQRKMAVYFSVAGYLSGTVYCLLMRLWGMELTVFLTYLFSGVVIAILSSCFHFKCSGHASGMAGPITMLGMQVSPLCFLGYGLLVPVFSSSIKLQRHTREELVAGALTPAALLLLLTQV